LFGSGIVSTGFAGLLGLLFCFITFRMKLMKRNPGAAEKYQETWL
jgi:hypothetical protein